MRVVYTDPAWAMAEDGRIEPGWSDLEGSVLGSGIDIDPGLPAPGGGYIISGDELYEHVHGADALVVYRCQVTPRLLAAAGPGCRVVARSGVGIDNLNAELLAQSGLYGFHIPDYCGDEVSTHTLALLLALERGVCVQDRLIRAGRWGIHRGGVPRRLAERTAGIVGFGRIGTITAHRLRPFYRSILAYDPYVPRDVMLAHGAQPVDDLNELFARADAVMVHAALTPQTDGLINQAVLASARPGCLLVNSARGRLVDTAAVLDSLEQGALGGFASDVFAPEDPNDSAVNRKLLDRDDVVVTAHRAFLSIESELSLRRRIAGGLAAVLVDGVAPPEGRVA